MILDIFSSFDPNTTLTHSSVSPSLFWLLNLTLLIIISSTFWLRPTNNFWIIHETINIITSQVSRTFRNLITSSHHFLTALFIILISINLIGLLPYVFSSTRHLLFTLRLGLPIWLALIISSIKNSPSYFAASLLPSGAPDWLNPFLVLIETARILLRPITLSFRLAANMRAGHVVLTLAGIYATFFILINSPFPIISFFLFQLLYILFEVGICLIQAYIFCLLLSLYSDDHTA